MNNLPNKEGTISLLEQLKEYIEREREALSKLGMSEDDVEFAMQPMLAFQAGVEEDLKTLESKNDS